MRQQVAAAPTVLRSLVDRGLPEDSRQGLRGNGPDRRVLDIAAEGKPGRAVYWGTRRRSWGGTGSSLPPLQAVRAATRSTERARNLTADAEYRKFFMRR